MWVFLGGRVVMQNLDDAAAADLIGGSWLALLYLTLPAWQCIALQSPVRVKSVCLINAYAEVTHCQ